MKNYCSIGKVKLWQTSLARALEGIPNECITIILQVNEGVGKLNIGPRCHDETARDDLGVLMSLVHIS